MIEVVIFYIHAVAAIGAFTKRWQEGGIGEGILGVAFMALIFSVGWSMTTFAVRFVTPEKGYSRLFDRDALSLLLLSVIEAFFYYFYLRESPSKAPEQTKPDEIKKP